MGGCGKDASRWVAMELGFHSDFDPNWKQLTCRSVSWPLLLTDVFGELSAGLGKRVSQNWRSGSQMDHQGGQAGGGAQTASPASLAPQWSAKLDAHVLLRIPGPQGLSAALFSLALSCLAIPFSTSLPYILQTLQLRPAFFYFNTVSHYIALVGL